MPRLGEIANLGESTSIGVMSSIEAVKENRAFSNCEVDVVFWSLRLQC